MTAKAGEGEHRSCTVNGFQSSRKADKESAVGVVSVIESGHGGEYILP